jgi:toxin ParE1/3/4
MRIDWSARARTDLREIKAFITHDSPYYALSFIEKIFQSVEKLQTHPHIGRKVPEVDQENVRELIFQGYRILYRAEPQRIYIVTVLHGSRDLEGQAAKPWEVI